MKVLFAVLASTKTTIVMQQTIRQNELLNIFHILQFGQHLILTNLTKIAKEVLLQLHIIQIV